MVALSVKEIFLMLALSGNTKDIVHSGKLTGPPSKVQMEEVFQQGESWLFYSVLRMCPYPPPALHLVLGESTS